LTLESNSAAPGSPSECEVPGTNSTGPLGALATVGVTCLVLAIFQTAFWLVVPLILALVLYYLLRPGYLCLLRIGMAPGPAAGVAVACFSAIGIAALAASLPWLRTLVLENHATVERYRGGGAQLVNQVMVAMDTFVTKFASDGLRDEVRRAIPDFVASLGRIVEPSVASMSRWLPAIVLVPFLTFFLLKEGRQLKALLARPVPNAFFERSLVLLHRVDEAAKAYFRGLLRLTMLDATALSAGLAVIGLPHPVLLGVASAVLMWIPYVGGIFAAVAASIVAITEFPDQPGILYGTLAWYLVVRELDGFVFMPLTIGKSLHIHPVVAVLTILLAGAIAGIPGMMLALPVFGILKVLFDSSSLIVLDERLQARHCQERILRRRQATAGLLGIAED
jgi:predicted PurR-regulated permease PerM